MKTACTYNYGQGENPRRKAHLLRLLAQQLGLGGAGGGLARAQQRRVGRCSRAGLAPLLLAPLAQPLPRLQPARAGRPVSAPS